MNIKNIKEASLVIVLLIVSMSVTYGQTIVGRWEVDVTQTEALMPAELKLRYDTLTAEVKERARLSLGNKVFQFNANESVDVSWTVNRVSRSLTGTWQITSDELLITMQEQQTRYSLSQPSSDVLILNNAAGNGFFNILYLTKTP